MTVNGGTLKASSSTALGNATGETTIASGASLDLNGAQSNAERITAGGTLDLNVTGTIPGGTTIQVLQAAGFTGAFSSITPATPGPGQTWVTSNLLVDGTISVRGNAVNPQFASTTISNGNIVVSGSGGAPLAAFEIRGAADLSASVRMWPVTATGNFDASGIFSASIPIGARIKFLILSSGN